MGLDAVELVMAAEEAFDIQITDDEAQAIRTPRQFYETVAKKVRISDPAVCLTQRAFYLLRRVLRQKHSIARQQFRPDTPLDSIIAKRGRRDEWEQLRRDLGAANWPSLKLPLVLGVTIWTVLLLGYFAIVALLLRQLASNAGIPMIASAIAMGGIMYCIYLCLTPFKTSFAGQTVGTLAEHLVASNPQLLLPRTQEWTMERIRLVLRKIISEQMGIKPDFDDDADFVRDLGLS